VRPYLPIGLWLALCAVCYAGPVVAVHPKAKSVNIWDDKFVVVQELVEPKQIQIFQDAFRRAKRIRNNATEPVRATHKIDFAERWLIDIDSGELVVLSKAIVDVYVLDAKDLIAVRALIDPKAEQRNAADSR
jgi:hypothetical protein